MAARTARMAFLFLCLPGCGGKRGDTGPAPTTGADADTDADADADADTDTDAWPAFALGVEYGELGLVETYAATGVRWTKLRLAAFEWGAIEPEAPEGGVHTYDWGCTDAYVVGHQQAGLVDVMAYLSPRSAWGSVDAGHVGETDIMPAAEHIADFRLFVRELMERYDDDGTGDAAGLLAPVRYWVVGPEWTGFWPSGDHADYLELAAAVAEEARDVHPSVHLGTIPFFMPDVFAGNEPSAEEIALRLEPPDLLRNSTEGILAILDHPESFDFVSIHSLGHYTEVPPTLSWFREQMTNRGYELPVWLDDAFPVGSMANALGLPPLYPVTEERYDEVFAVIRAVARKEEITDPPWSVAKPWLDGLVAAEAVKKVVTALGEGAAGIQLGNTEDWLLDAGPSVNETIVAFQGAASAFGMVEVTHPGGYDLCDARMPGAARPVLRNVELLADKLGDGAFDAKERIGGTEGARGYRLERGGAPLWVLWNEDGILRLPGDPEEVPVEHVLEVPGVASVRVTRAVVEAGAPAPVERILPVAGGSVTLSLSSVPVFVEPD